MHLAIILTATDRAGLAKEAGKILRSHGGNVETSRMVTLGSQFVISALVAFDRPGPGLADDLVRTFGEAGYDVMVHETDIPPEGRYKLPYRLESVALDHPGIVEAISGVVRSCDGNIVDAETELVHAPWSGAPSFSFRATVYVPDAEAGRKLRDSLDELAAVENLDVELSPLRRNS